MFQYWLLFEGYTGQSSRKLVLNFQVVDREGEDIDFASAAVESFGWLAWPGEKERLFNRISNTIVIEAEEDREPPENVEYVYPDE